MIMPFVSSMHLISAWFVKMIIIHCRMCICYLKELFVFYLFYPIKFSVAWMNKCYGDFGSILRAVHLIWSFIFSVTTEVISIVMIHFSIEAHHLIGLLKIKIWYTKLYTLYIRWPMYALLLFTLYVTLNYGLLGTCCSGRFSHLLLMRLRYV